MEINEENIIKLSGILQKRGHAKNRIQSTAWYKIAEKAIKNPKELDVLQAFQLGRMIERENARATKEFDNDALDFTESLKIHLYGRHK